MLLMLILYPYLPVYLCPPSLSLSLSLSLRVTLIYLYFYVNIIYDKNIARTKYINNINSTNQLSISCTLAKYYRGMLCHYRIVLNILDKGCA